MLRCPGVVGTGRTRAPRTGMPCSVSWCGRNREDSCPTYRYAVLRVEVGRAQTGEQFVVELVQDLGTRQKLALVLKGKT